MIPRIDIAPLFDPPSPTRDRTDQAILEAARRIGFLSVHGQGTAPPLDIGTRQRLLAIFALPHEHTAPLWRRGFAADHPNLYRGWFPPQPGGATFKEGIDLGPDLVRQQGTIDDPLGEPSPLPPDTALPGWRQDAAAYYLAMERIGIALMHAIARGLGLPETVFDAALANGISTLRLLRYPVRSDPERTASPETIPSDAGLDRRVTGAAHVDSGLVTLLAQDGVPGLQARLETGSWVDIPPEEGSLAVNFGRLLERWTGGHIRATEHRVLGDGRIRHSIPFFLEPAIDAVIAPLPLPGLPSFAPFAYGDHLWAAMTRFIEFRDLANARPPRGVPAA